MDLYPLTFEPQYLPKIWGGRKMETLLGRPLPPGPGVGESWELCDRPGRESVVAAGALKGATLHQVFLEYGPRLVGRPVFDRAPARFPLLVKILDAAEDLSVQVHPGDDYAALHGGPDETGKTEAWALLQADPGARVIAGLKPGIGRDEWKAALAGGDPTRVLNRFEAKEGDAVFVPAGRVHAVGKGCLVAEVQQNSDTTYRVWDWGRLEDGRPRELHPRQALETIRFDAEMAGMPDRQPQKLLRGDDFQHAVLAQCQHFTLERVWVDPLFRPGRVPESFHILMGFRGRGLLRRRSGPDLTLEPGRTVLVPASVEDWRVERQGAECQVLWTRI